jgi:hypothetical protein
MPQETVPLAMPPVADAPLADLYRDAAPETAAAFVADLYEARGWEVDRRGDRQFVASAGGGERQVAVVHPDDDTPADLVSRADTVVALDGTGVAGDADGVGAASQRQQIANAPDRSTGRELLQSHFGWSPEVQAGGEGEDPQASPGNAEPRGVLGAVAGSQPSRSRLFVATALVFAVAMGAAVAAGGLGDVGLGSPDGTDSGGPDAPTATATPTPTTEATATPAESTPAVDQEYLTPAGRVEERIASLPPGVNRSGETDRRRLTDAHESVLENESYRLSITYREAVNGRPAGVYTETLRVANNTRYSASVTQYGTLQAPVPSIAGTDMYANGSARFERENGSVVQRGVVLSYDQFLAGQTRFLAVFLDVRESWLVDAGPDNGTASVYLVTEGNPATLIRDTSGSVRVREDGLVTRARWTYGFSEQLTEYENVTATFRMQVSDVGSTTVREPEWVNVTATASGNATSPTDGTATNGSG